MLTATYSPDDNKLRLYSSTRLDKETYERVRTAGFRWAPKQDLFVAPMWTPQREDLLIELCGEIDDEDTSLVDRAEERSERFEGYSERRAADADAARKAVSAIADNIPLGQPILVGHHSERHARKDAERIENGMRRAVKMWKTSQYWEQRASGAIRHAKYKERPDVRARRIKTIEADKRKQERIIKESELLLKAWRNPHALGKDKTLRELVIFIANRDGGYYLRSYKRKSGYEGPITLWDAAGGNIHDEDPETVAIATPQEIIARAIENHEARIAWAQRWVEHYDNRLAYERAMLADAGGIKADQVRPEKGGACRCIWAPRGGWAYIQKVNRVSVSVHFKYRSDGNKFSQTVPFDKLTALMSAADVQKAREEGRLIEGEDGIGFLLRDVAPKPEPQEDTVCPDGSSCPDEECRVNHKLAEFLGAEFPLTDVRCADFLACNGDLGKFDRMSWRRCARRPPNRCSWSNRLMMAEYDLYATVAQRLFHRFEVLDRQTALCALLSSNAEDIKHIEHAFKMLRSGGRLVAICANGPRQRERFIGKAVFIDLPPGSFEESGTSVNAAIVIVMNPPFFDCDELAQSLIATVTKHPPAHCADE